MPYKLRSPTRHYFKPTRRWHRAGYSPSNPVPDNPTKRCVGSELLDNPHGASSQVVSPLAAQATLEEVNLLEPSTALIINRRLFRQIAYNKVSCFGIELPPLF